MKFAIKGTNFNAFRVPLGQRLMLSEFFGKVLKEVLADQKLKLADLNDEEKMLGLVLKSLSSVMSLIGDQYKPIVADCTDMPREFLEQQCEIEDLFLVFKKIWEANGFGKTLASLNKNAGLSKKGPA